MTVLYSIWCFLAGFMFHIIFAQASTTTDIIFASMLFALNMVGIMITLSKGYIMKL